MFPSICNLDQILFQIELGPALDFTQWYVKHVISLPWFGIFCVFKND